MVAVSSCLMSSLLWLVHVTSMIRQFLFCYLLARYVLFYIFEFRNGKFKFRNMRCRELTSWYSSERLMVKWIAGLNAVFVGEVLVVRRKRQFSCSQTKALHQFLPETVGYLQAWPRRWAWDCREQIQSKWWGLNSGPQDCNSNTLTNRSARLPPPKLRRQLS